ncbi:type IV toxin-antitoxin system AbiEi family antitoxin [Thiorhodococcus fuscus]|uniref:Type IV toxin-antitoxin system AbiEi family antitoxin n=1 Tax=Thiorhodococcus fuscus TaxID=527200 RepID=A0ABW4YCY3_9GAMM
MDTLTSSDIELIKAASAQLARLNVTAKLDTCEPLSRADARLRLGWSGGTALYRVEVKRSLRPSTLGAVALQLKELGPDALLVSDHVSPPLAERLRDLGIQFIDSAGNAFLAHPALLIWVKGERPQEHLNPPAPSRAFKASGLRVLFALLSVPELVNQPYRAIADKAGVAHGTVGSVMTELPKLGFLAEIGGKRRLLQPERLLRQWIEAYARTLRPKLLLRIFQAPTISWWRELDFAQYGLTLGGEAAAARITGIIEPQTVTLYGTKAASLLFMAKQPMRAAPDGNVEILSKFWGFDQDPPTLTPPLLIYADLLTTGDARCIEAAQEMEGRLLDRFAG